MVFYHGLPVQNTMVYHGIYHGIPRHLPWYTTAFTMVYFHKGEIGCIINMLHIGPYVTRAGSNYVIDYREIAVFVVEIM